MRSLVRPTQILNSFMLHGCSGHFGSGTVVGVNAPITHVCSARERGRTRRGDWGWVLRALRKHVPFQKLCYLERDLSNNLA